MEISEQVLEEAREARRAYLGTRAVGLISGGAPDLESDPDRKHYIRVATQCIENGIKAGDFIRVASRLYIGQDRYPDVPEDYVNASLITRYKAQGHGVDPTPPEVRWDMQERRLKGVASRFGVTFDVFGWLLHAPGLESWFRVLWPYNDRQIAKYHGAEAYAELSEDPRIVRLMRLHRPEALQEMENEYGKLYAGETQ